MKKITILILLVIFTTALFAGTPRTYLQKCILNDGNMPDVNNTGLTHNPNYVLRADNLSTEGEVLGTDLGTPASQLRIFRSGNGTTVPYYTGAYLQLAYFTTQWAAGDIISFEITYVPTAETTTWQWTIPTGTSGVNVLDPAVVIPPTISAGPVDDDGDVVEGTTPTDPIVVDLDPINGEDGDGNPISIIADVIVDPADDNVDVPTVTVHVYNTDNSGDIPNPDNMALQISINVSTASTVRLTLSFEGMNPVPTELIARVMGAWTMLGHRGDATEEPYNIVWTATNVSFDWTFLGTREELLVALNDGNNSTLPVELSSFDAIPYTENLSVELTWVSQSETDLLGYNLYRSTISNFETSVKITPNIINASGDITTGSTYNHVDNTELSYETTYYYWLEAINNDQSRQLFNPVSATIGEEPTHVVPVPDYSALKGNYPNPFNPTTTIAYDLKESDAASASITIYNVLGQKVKVYSNLEVGFNKSVTWNGKDLNGQKVASGVYFYRFNSESYSQTRKALMLK